jgi:hypothetical protein
MALDSTSSVLQSSRWTADSISRLTSDEIKQLRTNAEGRGAGAIVALCDSALTEQPSRAPKKVADKRPPKNTLLAPRRAAFEMRGVTLRAGLSSWGAVRDSDKTVVFCLWADNILSEDGGCSYLLWAPNQGGSHPWSDMPAGKERLQHCKLAEEQGHAEGLLAYGKRLAGHQPEERAATVSGVDTAVVLRFRVVRRGEEYWAVWGGRAAPAAPETAPQQSGSTHS